MRELQGKVGVVTGAAGGIGLALAERFVSEGMRVVMADVDEAGLEKEVTRLGEAPGAEVLGVPTDVRDPAAVTALADRTVEKFGSVNVVCNNAGVAPAGPMLETTPDDWRWIVDVNLMGVAYGVTAFGPRIKEAGEGHIVNVASEAGLVTSAWLGMYSATKHAVVGLSESLYRELEDSPIGVSVLCPNLVRTGIFHSERNRDDGAEMRPMQTAMMAPLQEAVAAQGIEPATVADRVVDAIRNDRFWIFTHPETSEYAGKRFEDIREGRNPTNPYPSGL